LAVDAETWRIIVNARMQHQWNDLVVPRVHVSSICRTRYLVFSGVAHPTTPVP
jgi:hypothetical protein